MSDLKPPLHFMSSCSKVSLESYELARLNAAANLRRELFELADRWIEAEVDSRLARWVLQHRDRNPDLRIEELVALDSPDYGTKRLPSPRPRSNAKRALPPPEESPSPRARAVSEQSESADAPDTAVRPGRLAQMADDPAPPGEVAARKRTPPRRSRTSSEQANKTARTDSIRPRPLSPPELPQPALPPPELPPPVLPRAQMSCAPKAQSRRTPHAVPHHGHEAALHAASHVAPDVSPQAETDLRVVARRGPAPNRAAPGKTSERDRPVLEITHRAADAGRPKAQISKRAEYCVPPGYRDQETSARGSREADLASLLEFPAPASPLAAPSAARGAPPSPRGADYFRARHAIRGRIRQV